MSDATLKTHHHMYAKIDRAVILGLIDAVEVRLGLEWFRAEQSHQAVIDFIDTSRMSLSVAQSIFNYMEVPQGYNAKLTLELFKNAGMLVAMDILANAVGTVGGMVDCAGLPGLGKVMYIMEKYLGGTPMMDVFPNLMAYRDSPCEKNYKLIYPALRALHIFEPMGIEPRFLDFSLVSNPGTFQTRKIISTLAVEESLKLATSGAEVEFKTIGQVVIYASDRLDPFRPCTTQRVVANPYYDLAEAASKATGFRSLPFQPRANEPILVEDKHHIYAGKS